MVHTALTPQSVYDDSIIETAPSLDDNPSPLRESAPQPAPDAPPKPKRPRRDANALACLQAAATAHGGECLDDFCAKLQAKYRFRCAHGHEWLGWGHLVLVGKWCRICANQRMRRTIEDMHEAARKRGGLCLSTEYLGCETPLTWRCEEAHTWQAAPRNVHSRGTWCPHCARIKRRKQPSAQAGETAKGDASAAPAAAGFAPDPR